MSDSAPAPAPATKKNEPQPLPEWLQHRMNVWDRISEEQKIQQAKDAAPIKVTLPSGKVIDATSWTTTPFEIAKQISRSLAEKVVIAKVDGNVWDLLRPLEQDCALELLDFEHPDGKKVFWHSSAHILGQAIERIYPNAKLCIGPALEEGGFYYDVYLDETKVTPADYKNIEKLIDTVIKEKQVFTRMVASKEQAKEMFKDNQFKLEIINNKVPDNGVCSIYRCGTFIDLCKGPHISNSSTIKAMCVTKNSSAYWLSRADRESLQRVYGISFPSKDQLKQYQILLKAAEERDHRRVGTQQKLFFFNELSPGSCFFLPHGARIYNGLVSFIRNEYHKRGYSEVISPNVFNIDLWKTSGHYEHYKDNMFLFKCENQEFGMKPMNCPGHCVMFGSQSHSYRELPLRFADFGVLHRNELSGALHGLTRVRRFQQDDAHIFCMRSQIEQEVDGVLDFLKHVYGIFGFTFVTALSTRPEKFIGEVETWDQAEAALRRVLVKHFGDQFSINHGDGAFYGPKIDIQLFDALRRKHQCGTIQLDFQLPQRFNLQFKDTDGDFKHVVMIHRAILGSVERMFAILVEHTGGKWPFWISPRQVCIVPVAEKYTAYAQEVHDALHAAGFYVDIDDSNSQFNKKIRDSQVEGYNFTVVVGEKEEQDRIVTLRNNRKQAAAKADEKKEKDEKKDDESAATTEESKPAAEAPKPVQSFDSMSIEGMVKYFNYIRSHYTPDDQVANVTLDN